MSGEHKLQSVRISEALGRVKSVEDRSPKSRIPAEMCLQRKTGGIVRWRKSEGVGDISLCHGRYPRERKFNESLNDI